MISIRNILSVNKTTKFCYRMKIYVKGWQCQILSRYHFSVINF